MDWGALLMRIATFNVQNLRLRHEDDGKRLDGALDRDSELRPDRRLDILDRRLTAEIIAQMDADILCLQEVFDLATLEFFQDNFLQRTGFRAYNYYVCEPGNDGHGLNVAVMARRAPDRIVSHAKATARDLQLDDPQNVLRGGPVFRRDCLEVGFGAVTLFVCHLKAPYPDWSRAAAIRALEAEAIRRIVEAHTRDPKTDLWMILGDLNTPVGTDPAKDAALSPLLEGLAVDLMNRVREGDDWTYVMPDSGARLRPDAMLASPALANLTGQTPPKIERGGMARGTAHGSGGSASMVGAMRPHASDHAAIWIDLPDEVFLGGAAQERGGRR